MVAGCSKTDSPELATSADAAQTTAFEPEYIGGYPTKETADAMFEEYDYQAAVQFYIWAYAYLNGMGFDKGLAKLGGDSESVYIFDKRAQSQHQIMTANSEVIYVWTRFMDVSKGPIVLEVPPRCLGHFYDVGMRSYSDLGAIGPDRGKGGKYLLVSKDYNGELPEGYFVVRPEYSNLILLGARAFPTKEGSEEKAVELAKGFKRYYYSELDKQQEPNHVFVGNRSFSQEWPRDERAFEWFAEIFNKDRVPETAKAHLGNMRNLGIEVGKPFNPDDRAKKILKRAAKTGEAVILSMAFGQRDEEQDRVYDNRQYMAAFPNQHNHFMMENYEEVEERARGWHELVGNFVFDLLGAPAGKGQIAMVNYNDANGDHLMGEHTYHLHVSADVPVNNFWQVPVYSVLTRSMIITDQGSYAFTSTDEFNRNEDGSLDLYFGPKLPEGISEKNWVKTIPGEGWFTLPRLYGALQPVLDKTWRWNDIEKIK
jgi:hypothetical protein